MSKYIIIHPVIYHHDGWIWTQAPPNPGFPWHQDPKMEPPAPPAVPGPLDSRASLESRSELRRGRDQEQVPS